MKRPRVGCLGVGWIGRMRLRALSDSGAAEIVALADSSAEALAAASEIAPHAARLEDAGDLFAMALDGVVIATPSAQHAEQCRKALGRGLAVFCQKPLGRDAEETRSVVAAARAADRLLRVDLSYRHTAALRGARALVGSGELGRVFAAELAFHNAYGPDRPWFYERRLAGGGCLIDLGIHLVDAALWTLGFPDVDVAHGRLYAGGERLRGLAGAVEDYALAHLDAGGAVLQLGCSWRLPAGCDAVIGMTFYGTRGGVRVRNVGGSFYDFVLERLDGTRSAVLARPPDAWGGRALVAWAEALARTSHYDPAAEEIVRVAAVLDAIYEAAGAA